MSTPTKPVPGAADFDVDAPGVTAAQLQEHLGILQARAGIKALTAVPEVAPAVQAAPEITKYSTATGLPVSMSAQSWGLLTDEYAAQFETEAPPAAKPAEPAQ